MVCSINGDKFEKSSVVNPQRDNYVIKNEFIYLFIGLVVLNISSLWI
jgi:hypothetical protein